MHNMKNFCVQNRATVEREGRPPDNGRIGAQWGNTPCRGYFLGVTPFGCGLGADSWGAVDLERPADCDPIGIYSAVNSLGVGYSSGTARG